MLYVVLLSAARDLVGPTVPKGVVLVAAVVPAFATKLTAPYFIHYVPYSTRVIIFVLLSALGMFIVAMSPSYVDGGTISSKVAGIVLASLSAGGGELSFMALTHFYGPLSLASWSSGTGAAGLVGAGAYALMTSTMGLSVRTTLLTSVSLPILMIVGFFAVLPKSPLHGPEPAHGGYTAVERGEVAEEDEVNGDHRGLGNGEDDGLLGVSTDSHKFIRVNQSSSWWEHARVSLQRMRKLFVPLYVSLFFWICRQC